MSKPKNSDSDDIELPDELPLLPIRDLVVFPFMIVPLIVTRELSSNAIEEALGGSSDRLIFLCTQRSAADEDPTPEGLHEVGCVGTIMRMAKMSDGRIKVLVQGLFKARMVKVHRTDPSYSVMVKRIDETPQTLDSAQRVEALALVRTIKDNLDKYIASGKSIPEEVHLIIGPIEEPGRLADLIASNLPLKVDEAQSLLETEAGVERLSRVNTFLERELEILNVQQRIQDQARQEMTRTQREYFLREQMRAIKTELGDDDSKSEELDELRLKITSAQMPEQPKKEANRQLRRLQSMHAESSEAAVLRNYLDWLGDLPWSKQTDDQLDIERAAAVLDEDHFALEKIKERIVEHLAVRKLKKDMRGPILCFVGPPGVGKTSLGRSIARAMDRKFAQASLGGLRDEAEIRGHRRTYVGAMPGRIIQGLKQAGSNNPVFMLDELDKLGADFRGDPSSALLEVLDPAQNNRFVDLYLNVPFDLSNVFFIATANVIDTIPGPLRDRMELIFLSGYTEEEKLEIALRHILPRAMEDHGLTAENVKIGEQTLRRLISDYTREAGLRNLSRQLATVCRKVARKVAEGKTTRTVVTPTSLPPMLGPPRTPDHSLPERDEMGVVTGLAWTQAGGEVLQIEASVMAGTGQLKLTGQLGDVMKESAHAALSYLRSRADALGIAPDFFKEREIHVHVPAGAIPKDGPSAGVTIATVLASVARGVRVRADVAMTGEITLRGHVLAVGGIKEKLLAAVRAGMKTVLLPAANEPDLADLPPNIRKKVRLVLCRHVEDVFREALVENEPTPTPPPPRPRTRSTRTATS
ncbi:MAG: endopeptidase La [Myxococcales bacterium]|nr:endopeptidase La [Myxococcales bacterium]